MNPTQLLEHFDRISEAPDAVAHLRRFILDLAVRGKLVEQDPNDEPAAELLKRIRTEKALCEKKTKELASVTEDEAPFDVPAGWKWVRIRQITIDRGQTVPKADFTYIDVTAIDKERGCIGEPTVLSASEAPSRARKVVQKGDVIYSCVRPYLLNIAVIDTDIKPPPIASTAFAVMNGFGLTLPQYLWTALRSPFMVESVEARMRGQAYPAINDSDFALLPIPLPPLAEQHRIVAKVDELMALCDQLEAAMNEREARRDRLVAASLHQIQNPDDLAPTFLAHLSRLTTHPEHIKQLRQTILSLAVRGRLVPQDPNDEPAAELLKQIISKKAERNLKVKTKSQKSNLVLEPTANGSPLPSGWAWAQLAELTAVLNGRAYSKHELLDDGTPVLRVGNLFTSKHWYYSNLTLEDDKYCDAGDLLFSWSASFGPFIWTGPKVIYHYHIWKLSLHSEKYLDKHYLYRFLLHKTQEIKDAGHGVSMLHMTKEKMEKVLVPLPPLTEQHRIVAKVDELMALCDQLEAQLTTTQSDSHRLLEAVLRDALAPALAEAA